LSATSRSGEVIIGRGGGVTGLSATSRSLTQEAARRSAVCGRSAVCWKERSVLEGAQCVGRSAVQYAASKLVYPIASELV
jgi:hypothetical protein